MNALRTLAMGLAWLLTGLATAGGLPAPEVGLEVSAGARSTWWFTSDDDDDQEGVGHAIDYFAEPAASWWASGAILVWGWPVIGASIQQPFDDSPEQREIIARTEATTSTLEDVLVYLDLMFLKDGEPGPLRRFVGGLRLDYRRFLFHGVGEAIEPAVFASRDSGLVDLPVGDTFRMKAEFEDWYLSLFSWRLGRNGAVRLGGYRSLLDKPHESIIDVYTDDGDNAALIVETRLSGWGGFVQLEAPTGSFLLRMGTVDFEPRGALPHELLYAANGSFSFLLDIQIAPRLALVGAAAAGRSSRLELSPRLGLLFRADALASRTEGLGVEDSELSMDILVDLGLRLVWRWG